MMHSLWDFNLELIIFSARGEEGGKIMRSFFLSVKKAPPPPQKKRWELLWFMISFLVHNCIVWAQHMHACNSFSMRWTIQILRRLYHARSRHMNVINVFFLLRAWPWRLNTCVWLLHNTVNYEAVSPDDGAGPPGWIRIILLYYNTSIPFIGADGIDIC